ncbi:MAG: 1,4-dihydroxy-2-naphthoate polyprenyltransferase [Deltaproteobacteria bacterium]|nr:1,4-dihydroxy-2-naphthoate polyprenyltransferase [Deltaproteobacteria bacterium]
MTTSKDVSFFRVWLMAIRPRTLPAAISPVVVGMALALEDQAFQLFPAMAALMCALLLQIGVNLANDYFDCVKGIDTSERLGPPRVTQLGLISPGGVKAGMTVIFFLAVLNGLYLVLVGGWPILVLGLAAILSALAYSGGPYPLASHGLGDAFVFIFFGLVAVCGTYYVQALKLTLPVFLMALPVGFLITAILVVNNLRDINTDRQSGKYTLAVVLGERGSKVEYLLLHLGAYLVPLACILGRVVSGWVLLVLLSLPLTVSMIKMVWKEQGTVLNQALAGTAKLAFVYSLLLAAGLLIPFYF